MIPSRGRRSVSTIPRTRQPAQLDRAAAIGGAESRPGAFGRAWEAPFAARAGRSDCLLLDALRARAVRLYPRDEERQDSAVGEFWSQLVAPEAPGKLPVLGRYDGERPLVPWLIRVFQNWHISQLRGRSRQHALPEEDLGLPMPESADGRWHDAFRIAARDWLGALTEQEVLILGLRLRYRQ